jgi:hypothetical protein
VPTSSLLTPSPAKPTDMYKEMEGLLLEQPQIITCKICSARENLSEYKSCDALTYMAENHVCYKCAFWLNRIANPSRNQEVIGGHLYVVNPIVKRPENVTKGYQGKEIYIRRFDETLIKTNNLFHIGEVPPEFIEHFPNTANFLTLFTYQKLKNYPFKCQSKGCWDRYHCVRYNLALEADGPFNIVPAKHKIGSEHCRSFININELKICQ